MAAILVAIPKYNGNDLGNNLGNDRPAKRAGCSKPGRFTLTQIKAPAIPFGINECLPG